MVIGFNEVLFFGVAAGYWFVQLLTCFGCTYQGFALPWQDKKDSGFVWHL